MILLTQAVAQLEFLSRRAQANGDDRTYEALIDAQLMILNALFKATTAAAEAHPKDNQSEHSRPIVKVNLKIVN